MDHMFGFYDNLKNTYQSQEGYELFADEGEPMKFPGVERAKIENVYNIPKKRMLFFYDYGDSWRFITQLVDVQETESKNTKQKVIKSVGEAPEQYPDWDEED